MKLYNENGAEFNATLPDAPDDPEAEAMEQAELARLIDANRAQYFRLHKESLNAALCSLNFLRPGEPFALAG